MVKGIEEGGKTLEEVRAAYGQEAPTLAPEKVAMLNEGKHLKVSQVASPPH